MNPVQRKNQHNKVKSLESIETEEIDSGTDFFGAPLHSSGLAINGEAMGTKEPVTA